MKGNYVSPIDEVRKSETDRILKVLDERYSILINDFNQKYGNNYPDVKDTNGWQDYGKLQMLAFVLEELKRRLGLK